MIDASFPYKGASRHICSVKVVDPSINIRGGKGTGDETNDYASVIIYAKQFEDLPIIVRAGDIIRIHRADLKIYNDQRQYNVNVFYNASWCLFATERSNFKGGDSEGAKYKPVAFSGKSFTFESHERKLLDNLRDWARNYFSKQSVITNEMYTSLAKVANAKNDFDVLGKITQIIAKDAYENCVRIKDTSGTTAFMTVSKRKFPELAEGDVVRIRSANKSDDGPNFLELSPHSNILSFIASSKLAKDLKTKIPPGSVELDKKALGKKDQLKAPILLTSVGAKYKDTAVTPLRDLFDDSNAAVKANTTFRARFNVLKVEPDNVKDLVQSKAGKASQGKAPAKGAKPAGGNFYFAQFLVRDFSTAQSDNLYKVFLCSKDGQGADFFGGFGARPVANDQAARKKLEGYVEQLTRFNVFVDAVLERKNGFYFIKDTRIL